MNNKGQTATEFVMMLPWVLAFLFAFILFIVFCVRLSLFNYASFMASRVDRVWPEGSANSNSDSQVMLEVFGLMPNSGNEWTRGVTNSNLRVFGTAPFFLTGFGNFGFLWDISATVPTVSEPSKVCAGIDTEDNPHVLMEAESCQ